MQFPLHPCWPLVATTRSANSFLMTGHAQPMLKHQQGHAPPSPCPNPSVPRTHAALRYLRVLWEPFNTFVCFWLALAFHLPLFWWCARRKPSCKLRPVGAPGHAGPARLRCPGCSAGRGPVNRLGLGGISGAAVCRLKQSVQALTDRVETRAAAACACRPAYPSGAPASDAASCPPLAHNSPTPAGPKTAGSPRRCLPSRRATQAAPRASYTAPGQ